MSQVTLQILRCAHLMCIILQYPAKYDLSHQSTNKCQYTVLTAAQFIRAILAVSLPITACLLWQTLTTAAKCLIRLALRRRGVCEFNRLRTKHKIRNSKIIRLNSGNVPLKCTKQTDTHTHKHTSCVSRSTLCFTKWHHRTAESIRTAVSVLRKSWLQMVGDRNIYWKTLKSGIICLL